MSIEFDGGLNDYVCQNIDLKNELVFDIGSNVGKMTKKFISAGAKVISVEPQSELTHNKNYRNVFAIKNLCISDKVGKVIFYKSPESHNVSTCFSGWNKYHPKTRWIKTKIKCTTLNELIKEFGVPKYIKIDVEGYESKVISGLSHKVDYLSFEFVERSDDFIKCIDLIRRFGFKKMMTFLTVKIKRKKKIPGKNKVIRKYSIVNEFLDIQLLMKYFKSISEQSFGDNKFSQGDILIEL